MDPAMAQSTGLLFLRRVHKGERDPKASQMETRYQVLQKTGHPK